MDQLLEIALKPMKAVQMKDWHFCLLDERHKEVKFKGYTRVPFTRWDTPALRLKKKKKRKRPKLVNAHLIDFGTCTSTPKNCWVNYIGISCNLGVIYEIELDRPILVSSFIRFCVEEGNLEISDRWEV